MSDPSVSPIDVFEVLVGGEVVQEIIADRFEVQGQVVVFYRSEDLFAVTLLGEGVTVQRRLRQYEILDQEKRGVVTRRARPGVIARLESIVEDDE